MRNYHPLILKKSRILMIALVAFLSGVITPSLSLAQTNKSNPTNLEDTTKDIAQEPIILKKPLVIDGDTIAFNQSQRPYLRIWGIDAPEYKQKCYKEVSFRQRILTKLRLVVDNETILCGRIAKEKLTHIAKPPLVCEVKDIDRYQRQVVTCLNAQGLDIGEWMVAEGWAFDYRRYSDFYYQDAEKEAQQAKKGMWAYNFTWPWQWRRQN